MGSQAPQSQAAMLATITSDLDKIAPRFEMQPEQIEIIQTPSEFYQTLKVGCLAFIYDSGFLIWYEPIFGYCYYVNLTISFFLQSQFVSLPEHSSFSWISPQYTSISHFSPSPSPSDLETNSPRTM